MTRRQAGRRAKSQGDAFEKSLDGHHYAYQAEGRAVVWRTPAPVKVLGKVDDKGRFRGCFSGQGPVDYFGTLPGGRSIAFDAKSVTLTRRARRWKLKALDVHQAEALDAVAACGGVTAILLRVLSGNRVTEWVLPWECLGPVWWRWHREGGSPASLAPADIEEMGIEFHRTDGWLPSVLAYLESK